MYLPFSFASVTSPNWIDMVASNIALQTRPFKVLVVGGSYGGLGTALNLLDLCSARFPRFAYNPEGEPVDRKISVEITIVDERDGYCKTRL
jgi:hypothetical protein